MQDKIRNIFGINVTKIQYHECDVFKLLEICQEGWSRIDVLRGYLRFLTIGDWVIADIFYDLGRSKGSYTEVFVWITL